MKPGQKKILIRILDLGLVLLLLGTIIVGVTQLQKLRRHLASAQTALAQLESTLGGGRTTYIQLLLDPDQLTHLQDTLDTLDADLVAIEDTARPFLPLAPHLGWLPGIGGDVKAAPHLLDMARQTIDAVQALSKGLTPLAEQQNRSASGVDHLGPELVQGLVNAQPQLKTAQAALSHALVAREAVQVNHLSSQTRTLVSRFDHYQPLLQSGLESLAALPGLLGADDPRTYLLLAQNNHELRATGGFISGVGLVEIDGGQITELYFQDSYAVDNLTQPHPLPPAPLRHYMGAGMLMLRDANWWPDFPTSAQAVADLYFQDQGRTVDGVIAVDLTTLQLLVQALGPIQVPGYDQWVTGGNLQSMLMSYWESPRLTAPGTEGAEWWLHRKDFAADLLSALLTHLLEDATPDDLHALAQALSIALRERHLTVFVNSLQDSAVLREMGWDGALRPSDGDYLMVVDSNVGFNKVNPNIEQTVDYQAVVDETGQATVQLILAYRHRIERPMPACIHESRYGDRYADLQERCYWDYVRIYVPASSQLLQLTGADAPAEVYEENGRTVIATSFLLATGQARQIQVRYQPALPPSTSRYTLLVQKQPGTGALPLRVSISLPNGVRPIKVSPDGFVWLDNQAVWQGNLAQDREFELLWR